MLRRMVALQRTPLHPFHVAHGARLVPFAGWEMPVQYTSILEEHQAVRTRVGLFDVSHMGEVLITGPDALPFLDRLVTNDVASLPEGRVLYTVMCYDDGGVVDDLLIYRFSVDRFMLVINAGNVEKDLEWIMEKAVGIDCFIENVSPLYGMIAVQGPKALESVRPICDVIEGLGRFTFRESAVAGFPAIVSRTGYTGEDGVEFYMEAGRAHAVADAIFEAGKPHGITLAGLGARDSLRLEAGLPLYGHEISSSITPYQAGLGWVVKLNKAADFRGKQALAEEKAAGPTKKLHWFRLGGRRIARQGTPVLSGGEVVGKVLSGTLSPMTGGPIGSALIDVSADLGDLSVDLRGTVEPLMLAKPPLHIHS